ncbi:hypothetical protein GCM10010510_35250 [Streptomyces anandii JCM 4720]|nr:hypothetical protein GCM10010510_35250 [Streptomyces anandii JCM 4720]
MGWGELSGLRRGSRVHFVLAWVLCVLALLLKAVTWLPGPSRVPFVAVGALFVAVFPVVIGAMVRTFFSEGGRILLGSANAGRMMLFVRSLPPGLICAYAASWCSLLRPARGRRGTPRPMDTVVTTTPVGTGRSSAASGSR